LDVAAVQSVLDRIKVESRERLLKEAEVSPDLDEIIGSLTDAVEDSDKQLALQKVAYLARRNDLVMAKWLAGLDALISLES